MPHKNQLFMVFDVESIGLHGEGFSVGYVVMEDGREVESGYFYTRPENAVGTHEDYLWVKDNVVPAMAQDAGAMYWSGMGAPDTRTVRQSFWSKWEAWRDRKAILAADCLWPVEARFLQACVADDPKVRAWGGPYPFIDIASVRLAKGLDPLGTMERQDDENPPHHPLADARQSARLLLEALAL